MYGDNLYAEVGIRNLRKIGIIEIERFWDINLFPDLKGNAFLGQGTHCTHASYSIKKKIKRIQPMEEKIPGSHYHSFQFVAAKVPRILLYYSISVSAAHSFKDSIFFFSFLFLF